MIGYDQDAGKKLSEKFVEKKVESGGSQESAESESAGRCQLEYGWWELGYPPYESEGCGILEKIG